MKVIVISGQADSGKDTVARLIKSKLEANGKKVTITHFAGLLKYICSEFFGWDGRKDEKGRSLLQHIGTDIVRSIDSNYWVKYIADMIMFFGNNWDYVLIPDFRFPNEYNYLKECGYDMVHIAISRNNFNSSLTSSQKKHISETALSGVIPDYLVVNNGSLKELEEKIGILVMEDFNEKDQ